MTRSFRGLLLASLSLSALALAACGTTSGANVSNKADASRVDSILQRAAQDAKANGDKVETVTLLEQLNSNKPNDPAIATSFGQALREDEQLNRARQVLLPFTEGKTPYPDAVTELAMVQLGLGQYKEAELTARRAVELDPEQGRSYLALGTALDAQNYHEQAEVAFRKGLDKWKGDPAPILNNLALNLASQSKLDQAIDMLKKAKEISPGRMEIERNLRIISTLKETADDYLIKNGYEKKAPYPDQPVAKTEEKKEKSNEDIANKQLPKKEEAPKKAVKPVAKKEAVEKTEPAASSTPAKTQNFKTKTE